MIQGLEGQVSTLTDAVRAPLDINSIVDLISTKVLEHFADMERGPLAGVSGALGNINQELVQIKERVQRLEQSTEHTGNNQPHTPEHPPSSPQVAISEGLTFTTSQQNADIENETLGQQGPNTVSGLTASPPKSHNGSEVDQLDEDGAQDCNMSYGGNEPGTDNPAA